MNYITPIKINHLDRLNVEMAKYFVWCDKWFEVIKDEGQKVVLCHFPIAHWGGQMHKTQIIHLYGHIHQTRDTKTFEKYGKMWEKEIGIIGITFKAANVGCMIDYMDYTPRTLEEIKKAKGWD